MPRNCNAEISNEEAFLRSIGSAKCCLLSFCPSALTMIDVRSSWVLASRVVAANKSVSGLSSVSRNLSQCG